MKVKTSISLSQDILTLIDQHADGERNRSAFIELAVRTSELVQLASTQ
jgi:metal-responsive CopG/Arc/MetJ family transcriptional regulator